MVTRSRVLLIATLLVALTGTFLVVSGWRYRSLVIHHSASATGNYESIRKLHRGRGWSDAAYHLILSNGSTDVPLGHLEGTWRHRFSLFSVATRSRSCNLTGIHLCVVGNYEKADVPDSLRPALAHAVRSLQAKYGIPDERIYLHRECSNTQCPGEHLTRAALAGWAVEDVSPDVRSQQLRVIDSALISPAHPLRGAALVALTASALLGAGWLLLASRRPARAGRRRRRRTARRSR